MEEKMQLSAYERYVNQRPLWRYYLGLVRRWMNHRRYEKISNIARKRGAKVGEYVCMSKAFAMKCNQRVEIGSHVVIETSDLSLGQWSLKIGNHVIIGRDVRLYLNGHDVHNTEIPFHRRHPEGLVIDDYVWVCPGVCVLPSVDWIGMGG